MVFYRTVIKYVELRICCDGSGTALFVDKFNLVVVDFAIATEVVNRTMQFATFEVV